MVDLIAERPFAGATFPMQIGGIGIDALNWETLLMIQPRKGALAATTMAFQRITGATLPARGRMIDGPVASYWAGRNAYLVRVGQSGLESLIEGLGANASITDQSDAYAGLSIRGELAEAALARLVPIDLHSSTFSVGATARTLVGHIACQVSRTERGLELLGPRSFAQSFLHDIVTAAQSVTAQSLGRAKG